MWIVFVIGSLKNDCAIWANSNECTKNPTFMWAECSEECTRIGATRKSYNHRCPRTKNEGILKPFELNTRFENILEEFSELQPEMVSKEPPIIVFDSFTSHQEADAFIGYGQGKYKRSTGLEMKSDGSYSSVETTIRTSSNTWCQDQACLGNKYVKNVTNRVSLVTKVPENHFEYAQLLHYHACERENSKNCSFYKRHHDFIPQDTNKNQGVRIYTCFIYLNDVEEGGFTVFDSGISVQPKKGRAVLWPSVLNEFPHRQDSRTHHEAKPVLKGEKYAANFWVHQYDFKNAHLRGCTM
tara:strand:- start:1708 stop:2598 length:891 start_codon:yes stop_codon:yes gene_type:complete